MEDNTDIFTKALGIHAPWYIESINFDIEASRLDVTIDFKRGTRFEYINKEDGIDGVFPVHDTISKSWRHLNFFKHDCYLHCRVPRVKTDSGHVRRIQPPWEGKVSGFSILFEALLMQFLKQMPVSAVARIVKVDDEKLWRMLNKYVDKAREFEDFSEVTQIGVDETSRKKRHSYVTLFVDLKTRKTIFVTKGKDHKTVIDFCEDLKEHKGDPNKITDVSSDMSKAFIKGVTENLPNAKITFDRFHIMKLINNAVGDVRRAEAEENPLLRGTKNIFDSNRQNLSARRQQRLAKLELKSLNLKTVRAFHIRENFQEIYKAGSKEEFVKLLKQWYSWARRCRLQPIMDVAITIKEHWDGVVAWFQSQINNGILEGLNSLVQSAKSKARGYRTFENFRAIIYLVTGGLDFTKVNAHYKS